jgi:hypothetical protein
MRVALGMQQLIWAGFATCAMASASVPALSWSLWPDFAEGWFAQGAAAAPRVDPAPPHPEMCYANSNRR